jgi:hypothetical protein
MLVHQLFTSDNALLSVSIKSELFSISESTRTRKISYLFDMFFAPCFAFEALPSTTTTPESKPCKETRYLASHVVYSPVIKRIPLHPFQHRPIRPLHSQTQTISGRTDNSATVPIPMSSTLKTKMVSPSPHARNRKGDRHFPDAVP